MNERIRELALQAGGEFYEGFAGSTNFVKFAENDFEKFAELIVKECCVALNPMLRDMISRGQGADLIKKHFGIEE
jgi:hypothetical protein